jgi:hypothetical protein
LRGFEKYAQGQVAFIDKMSAEIKDSERNQLFLMIGQALSAWTAMEEFLVIIVAIAIGSVADRCLLSGVMQTPHFKGVRTVFDPELT